MDDFVEFILEAVEREESAELTARYERRSAVEAENERKGDAPKTQTELGSLTESAYEAEMRMEERLGTRCQLFAVSQRLMNLDLYVRPPMAPDSAPRLH